MANITNDERPNRRSPAKLLVKTISAGEELPFFNEVKEDGIEDPELTVNIHDLAYRTNSSDREEIVKLFGGSNVLFR